ncbi:hypothetical protein CK203_034105 [Vitis vinifera]|uniref:GPI inositol-deacylase PGAP1-like alpha/beta domain-containing protein n=1 Tax=Vitis vinifera TaxID=29760 RepID=A0A438IBA2_VITVI|nr:hypothetical protein CK203_034105 [Vitis vinifera]
MPCSGDCITTPSFLESGATAQINSEGGDGGCQTDATCARLERKQEIIYFCIVRKQVRSKLESLDGIVPPTHGFTISSTGMKNVWLSMEHQVSHTLLSLIDPKTNQPFPGTQRRVAIFAKMLRSGIPQSFNWMRSQPFQQSMHVPFQDKLDNSVPFPNSLPLQQGLNCNIHPPVLFVKKI